MTSMPMPSLFISHGSPMVALEPGAAGAFWQRLGPVIDRTFGRPGAIVAVSAHTAAREPVLLAGAQHEAVYDFGNFDPTLFTLRYDAPGAPNLAPRVAGLLQAAGITVHPVDQGGLDHGIWTVLRYLYPDADVPVLPLAFVPTQSPGQQFHLGEALAPLRAQNVLVLGTGSITHNLRRLFSVRQTGAGEPPEIPESAAFRQWMADRSQAHDWPALFDYRRRAPHAVDMHPTDEHLLPWFVAAGAGGADAPVVRLHESVTMGLLGMDAYAFGDQAPRLAQAL
jgi:4,5-DOPA dioxygenase extradiol